LEAQSPAVAAGLTLHEPLLAIATDAGSEAIEGKKG
jgi:hypothetical protein